MTGRIADRDILAALRTAEDDVETLGAISGGCLLERRRVETVLRRLAREAGYDLSLTDVLPDGRDAAA